MPGDKYAVVPATGTPAAAPVAPLTQLSALTSGGRAARPTEQSLVAGLQQIDIHVQTQPLADAAVESMPTEVAGETDWQGVDDLRAIGEGSSDEEKEEAEHLLDPTESEAEEMAFKRKVAAVVRKNALRTGLPSRRIAGGTGGAAAQHQPLAVAPIQAWTYSYTKMPVAMVKESNFLCFRWLPRMRTAVGSYLS